MLWSDDASILKTDQKWGSIPSIAYWHTRELAIEHRSKCLVRCSTSSRYVMTHFMMHMRICHMSMQRTTRTISNIACDTLNDTR